MIRRKCSRVPDFSEEYASIFVISDKGIIAGKAALHSV